MSQKLILRPKKWSLQTSGCYSEVVVSSGLTVLRLTFSQVEREGNFLIFYKQVIDSLLFYVNLGEKTAFLYMFVLLVDEIIQNIPEEYVDEFSKLLDTPVDWAYDIYKRVNQSINIIYKIYRSNFMTSQTTLK